MINFTFATLSRRLLIFLGLITFSTMTWSQCTDLFFSQYIEGSGTGNKCLEIFNPTASTISLTDYSIFISRNGGTSTSGIALEGSIAAGEVFIICHPDETFTINPDQSSTNINFNGNDVLALIKSETIDVIGQFGNSSDFGDNATFIRKANVTQGDPNGSDAFSFVGSGEWDAGTFDSEMGLGSHTFNGCGASGPEPGDLVITEIMQDPASLGDNAGEWFEVYNPGNSPIDLNGFVIEDDGSDSHTIGSSVIVPAGGYAVLGNHAASYVDYTYPTNWFLGNSDDEVILSFNEVEIDRVDYDGGPNFPDPTGASMSLNPNNLNATDNNVGSNWCEASSMFSSGDFGTPGMANDACEIACNISNVTVEFDNLCDGSDAIFRLSFDVVGGSGQYEIVDDNLSTGYGNFLFGGASGNFFVDGTITGPTTAETLMFSIQEVGTGEGGCRGSFVSVDIATCPIPVVCSNPGDVIITEIMQNPASPVDDNDGEYIELYNTTGSPIDLNGWVLRDEDSDFHTINGSVIIPGNSFIVLGRNDDMVANGGISLAYEYSGISLANSADEVVLECSETVIDQVNYDGGPNFPDPTGASMSLDPGSFSAMANNDGANWCEASSAYGASGNLGTPGMANDDCCAPPTAVCSLADVTIDLNESNSIEAGDVDAGSTAECGFMSLEVSPNIFGCTQIGTTQTVTLTVTDANGDVSSCSANVQVNGLPCGFTQTNINCEGDTYSGFSPTTGEFYLDTECSETGYYRPSDSQGFIQSYLCGDGEIIAEVTDVEGYGFAGIAMREGTGPADKLIELGIDGVSLTRRSLRQSTGGIAFNHFFQTQGKNWLRLSRIGNTFSAFHSTDGSNWQTVLITNIQMSSCIYVGMYATSTSPGNPVVGYFENVSIVGSGGVLEAPTHGLDIAESPEQLTVFPNPATDEVNVNLHDYIGKNVNISILNVNGQIMKQLQIDEVYEGVQNLDVNALTNGTYMMRIESKDAAVTKRFIISGK